MLKAVRRLISRQEQKNPGLGRSECLTIMGIAQSTYSGWLKRLEQLNQRAILKWEQLAEAAERFKTIIEKMSYIPGKRTFREVYRQLFHAPISIKYCKKVMDFMHVEAYRPMKDAYKKQALYNHECMSPPDLVAGEFRLWPRTVILTDITYFYYGTGRKPFYLCSFMDAYTREVLGAAVSDSMSTESLVIPAYIEMIANHGDELKHAECMIHHDQGCQYLSVSFRTILSEDGILQSVSKRGCCKDNAPMESFWSRMKCHLLSTVALAGDYATAKELVLNYIREYNTQNVQYSLGGLTPEDFYWYTETGIYPLEKYFGVDASRLMSSRELDALRKRRQEALNRFRSETDAKRRRDKRENATAGWLKKSPLSIIERDRRLLNALVKEANENLEKISNRISHYKAILAKLDTAKEFLSALSQEELEKYRYRDEWMRHEELSYIKEMDQMFA